MVVQAEAEAVAGRRRPGLCTVEDWIVKLPRRGRRTQVALGRTRPALGGLPAGYWTVRVKWMDDLTHLRLALAFALAFALPPSIPRGVMRASEQRATGSALTQKQELLF